MFQLTSNYRRRDYLYLRKKNNIKRVTKLDYFFTLKLLLNFLKPYLNFWVKKTRRFVNRTFLSFLASAEYLFNLPFDIALVVAVKFKQASFKKLLKYAGMTYDEWEFSQSLLKISPKPQKTDYSQLNIRGLYALASLEGIKNYKKYPKQDLQQILGKI